MVKYIFKLKKDCKPGLTQNKKDNTVGIYLIYKVYRANFFKLFNKEIIWFKRKLKNKIFLRPYKKAWDKRTYRLPPTYWGKKTSKLTRLWVILPNDHSMGTKKIVPEASLVHKYVKLFGHKFESKNIIQKLNSYQNKFELLLN